LLFEYAEYLLQGFQDVFVSSKFIDLSGFVFFYFSLSCKFILQE